MKHSLAIILTLLAVVVGSMWYRWERREPSYLGHPISYWVEPWHHHGTETPEREAAAFAAMDERALRWLASRLDWRPSRVREGFARFMNSIIGDFMSDRDYDAGQREAALRALTRLGPRARSAIPAVEAASHTTVELRPMYVHGQALGALIRIREERVETYINPLKSAEEEDWTVLTYALAAQGTNAAAAAALLVEAVNQNNPKRWLMPTIMALGAIHSHPSCVCRR